jgi:magnesium-transporting ATPase (P-type)
VPWDAKLNKRADDALTRMEGEGHRVMAAAFRDLDPATEEERLARIDDIGVVGRVAPEHKVLLVETLRKKGDVVAISWPCARLS